MSIQLLSFIWLVSTAIGAALGASVNRSGMGASPLHSGSECAAHY